MLCVSPAIRPNLLIVKKQNNKNNNKKHKNKQTKKRKHIKIICYISLPLDRLVGLVVKASASRAGGPEFESR